MAAKIERIHFVEFNAKIPVLGNGVILPKYGTALLASIMRENGFSVRMFLEGVSEMDFSSMANCDLICMPVYFPILNKVKELAREIRHLKPGLPIVLGGPQACMFPETLLGIGDFIVRPEADEILPSLAQCLQTGGDVRSVPGLSFLANGAVVSTPDPAPPEIPQTVPDLGLIEGIEEATRLGRMRVINTLQTSRGCHFKCKFCPTGKLFGHSYRNRDIDSIIRDIRSKLRFGPLFFVVDNSFLSNRGRTVELLERLIRENLGAHFFVFERHEIGRDTELLNLMTRAGVRCIIVGIESFDDRSLKFYDKRQRGGDVAESIRSIQGAGIHVIGTFVLGGDEDTREKAAEILAFVEKTGISPNLFIMHDIENKDSANLMIPMNRRFATWYRRRDPEDTSYCDYLTGNFVSYFPKRMKPSTLQECVTRLHCEMFSHKNNLRRMFSDNLFNATFGVGHGYGLKGVGESVRKVVDGYYMDYLRRIEEGLYDGNEQLIEENLAGLDSLPLPPPLKQLRATRRYRFFIPILTLPGFARIAFRRLIKWGNF